jgi:hypothetical protein
MTCEDLEQAGSSQFRVGASAIQGKRGYMEDRYSFRTSLSDKHKDIGFFGVCFISQLPRSALVHLLFSVLSLSIF